MSQSDIIAPILSYDDINKGAEDFLWGHKRNEILPVDIEAIAEFDLGLNIFPFPNLQQTFDWRIKITPFNEDDLIYQIYNE